MATNSVANTAAGDYNNFTLSAPNIYYQTGKNNYDNSFIVGEDISSSIKKLENRVIQLEIENTEQKRKIDEIENAKLYNKNGRLKEWYTLIAMLDSINYAADCGNQIMIADNFPEHKYGFINLTDGCIWEINIDMVKSSSEQMYIKNGRAILIPDAFNSIEGKHLLLSVINGR